MADECTALAPARPVRSENPSPMGLAAMAAVLHVAVLAARVAPRRPHAGSGAFIVWEVPAAAQPPPADEDDAPSNPHQTYCIGQVPLTFGMAVVALASWMHIIRTGSARSY